MIFSKKKDSRIPSKASPKKISAYRESLSILLEEIQLAVSWGRPSILLAVHGSRSGQGRAQSALEEEVEKISQNVEHIKLKETKAESIPGLILRFPVGGRKVYFFSHLDRKDKHKDGKDTYRALNLCRESFIENRIREKYPFTGTPIIIKQRLRVREPKRGGKAVEGVGA